MGYLYTESGLMVPDSFAEAMKIAPPDTNEIATSTDGRDITRPYVSALGLLYPQDEVLEVRGGYDYTLYRELLRDEQIAAVFAQRRLAVVSREWEVIPGGKKRQDKAAADFMREQLDEIKFDSVTDKMLFGVFYGYSVAECLWSREGARVVFDGEKGIKVRDRRRFTFDGDMRLRLRTMRQFIPGEELPDRKFWHFATGADHDDDPYGLGLAHWLYWPVLFKRSGIKFWLIFLEKFGQPTAKGIYPTTATTTERAKLLAALEAIQTDSGVILPKGMDIELIEAARSGTGDYTALFDRMNDAIAKVVLGQTLTSEAKGGQYKAQVQMEVRQDLVKADSDLVCQSFNRGPMRWMTEWNFPNAQPPQVWRKLDEEEDLSTRATRDKTIVDMGYKPTLKYITDTYGGEWEPAAPPSPPPGVHGAPGAPGAQPAAAPGARSAAPPPGTGLAFADPAPVDLADVQADAIDTVAGEAIEGMIDQIRDMVDKADSLESLRAQLAASFADVDEGAFLEIMRQAFAAAALGGRFDIIEAAQ